ncbi:Nuclear actin-protein involved in chromatin remodeling [Ascosphaera pollenicola]|nr:Nuclear actin-protein involved in chromatin remodeling [Ascosphaera pollenicola]
MTIVSFRSLPPSRDSVDHSVRQQPKPAPNVFPANDRPPFLEPTPVNSDGWEQSKSDPEGSAIVIDNGSHILKAGWSFQSVPQLQIPPVMSRYRDRKANRMSKFIGYDAYTDATIRGQIRVATDSGSSIIGNWDVMEGVLDYVFLKMGIDADGSIGGIGRPVVMTEPVANLGYCRRMMNEILFECYSAPSVTYGIDSLFSYRQNRGSSGLVLSSSHSSTHLIPLYNSRPILSMSSRLNWGGAQASEFLMKLLKLKYPSFPDKVTDIAAQNMVRDHCYVSRNYDEELGDCLNWEGLEERDRVIQYPYTEPVIVEKSAEELARIAERKRESGRRLQEQAAKMRLEKLLKKEQELEYYKDLQASLQNITKKEIKRILDSEDFKDEAALDRTIRELERSIKRSRNRDLGNEENDDEEPTFPLLDIPDEELDEAGLRDKRHQRLMKSNFDARQRAKTEKEIEKSRLAEEERRDREKRENELEDWIKERRTARSALIQKMKERERLKADLGNRKSLASQMRMKTLANLASDGPRKRRRTGGPSGGGGDEDDFGANDEDWGVYRTVATGADASEDEEEEDLDAQLKSLEKELLDYDPNFTENDTLAAQNDWTKSLTHVFLRGPWPLQGEGGTSLTARESHQLHLNVERIRVPEVIFQPMAIAGLDQAGIVEIAQDILLQRVANDPAAQAALLKDVFITGGNTMFKGFKERFETDLRAVLPSDSGLKVRYAADPILDAWRGAASWAKGLGRVGLKKVSVSREEYNEMGSEYMKDHGLGNAM